LNKYFQFWQENFKAVEFTVLNMGYFFYQQFNQPKPLFVLLALWKK